MFRYGTANPRAAGLAPPSAYPGGLSPVASSDALDGGRLSRRASRTDLDFEQALKGEGTVKLREGPDISLLGVSDSPMSPKFQQLSTPSREANRYQQPATPIVIPPTPELGSSQGQTSIVSDQGRSPSQASSNGLFLNTDPEAQSKRRSILRSPGTASSPDLATLIRKAKQKSRAEAEVTNIRVTSNDQTSLSQSSGSGLIAGNDRTRPRSSTQAFTHNPQSPVSPSSYRNAASDSKGKGKASSTEAVPPNLKNIPAQVRNFPSVDYSPTLTHAQFSEWEVIDEAEDDGLLWKISWSR